MSTISLWDLLETELKTKEVYTCSFLGHVVLPKGWKFSWSSQYSLKKYWKNVFIYSVGRVDSICKKIISFLLWIMQKIFLQCCANFSWFILPPGHIQNFLTSLPAASRGWWCPGLPVGQGRAWGHWGSPRHQTPAWAKGWAKAGLRCVLWECLVQQDQVQAGQGCAEPPDGQGQSGLPSGTQHETLQHKYGLSLVKRSKYLAS